MRFEKIVNRPVLFLFVSLVLILSGCREKEAALINLPATEIFSAKTNWAVIVSSHLRLREKPAADANTVKHSGAVYAEILSKEDSKTVVEEQHATAPDQL